MQAVLCNTSASQVRRYFKALAKGALRPLLDTPAYGAQNI